MKKIRPWLVPTLIGGVVLLVTLLVAGAPRLFSADSSQEAIPRFSPVVQEFTLLGDPRPQDVGTHEAEFRAADYEPIGYQSTMIGGYPFEGTLWRTTDQGHPFDKRPAMFLMNNGRLVVLVGTWDGDVRCAVPPTYPWVTIEHSSSAYRMFNIHDVHSVFPTERELFDGTYGTFTFTCDR